MQLILATIQTNATSSDPNWILWVIGVMQFLCALGVSVTGWYVHAIRDRLQRGDMQFDRLNAEHATLAVEAAMKNGEMQKTMYKDFVTRQEFERHTTRMAQFETETLRTMSRVETKLDLLLKREEAPRG